MSMDNSHFIGAFHDLINLSLFMHFLCNFTFVCLQEVLSFPVWNLRTWVRRTSQNPPIQGSPWLSIVWGLTMAPTM